MGAYSLPVDASLQALKRVDAEEILPGTLMVHGAPALYVRYAGSQFEVCILAGRAPGIALDTKAGRVLVRRGHAVGQRIEIARGEYLVVYWITDAGRVAAAIKSS